MATCDNHCGGFVIVRRSVCRLCVNLVGGSAAAELKRVPLSTPLCSAVSASLIELKRESSDTTDNLSTDRRSSVHEL